MKYLVLIFIAVGLASCSAPTEKKTTKPSYEIRRVNGTLKAEGDLKNGLKAGLWKVYDRNGKHILTREYSDFFTFKQSFPDTFEVSAKKDSLGRYYMPEANEEDKIWNKRLYRTLSYAENDFELPVEALKKVTLYGDRMFENPIKFVAFPDSIDGLHIKEFWYYNKANKQTEVQLKGFAASHKGEPLFWVLYEDLKPHLTVEMCNRFFARNFNSTIYKETNEDASTPLFKNPQHVEKLVINHEVNMWTIPL